MLFISSLVRSYVKTNLHKGLHQSDNNNFFRLKFLSWIIITNIFREVDFLDRSFINVWVGYQRITRKYPLMKNQNPNCQQQALLPRKLLKIRQFHTLTQTDAFTASHFLPTYYSQLNNHLYTHNIIKNK